jgi:hypothetical protein
MEREAIFRPPTRGIGKTGEIRAVLMKDNIPSSEPHREVEASNRFGYPDGECPSMQ